MLGMRLRKEFQGPRLKGSAIHRANTITGAGRAAGRYSSGTTTGLGRDATKE